MSKKPKCPLIGQDGNVFNLIGTNRCQCIINIMNAFTRHDYRGFPLWRLNQKSQTVGLHYNILSGNITV